MYLPVCEFLLLKPSVDLQNVPEFYKLFYSSQIEYKQERAWILSVLCDGLREAVDYEICERRFTVKILLTFYDSALSDSHTQSLVMKILQQMCSIKVVAWDLVRNRALLSWFSHTAASVTESRASSLILLLSTLWTTLLDGRDDIQPLAPPATTMTQPVAPATTVAQTVAPPPATTVAQTVAPALTTGSQKKAPPPCLPPLFTAELILAGNTLLQHAGSLCSDVMRQTLLATLNSAKQHALKTHKLYTERNYLNPIPCSLAVLNITV